MDITLSIVKNILIRCQIEPRAIGSIWFIHAFWESGLSYKEMFNSKLSERFNLYVPDFPGFGASPLQVDMTSLENSAEILVELIETISPKGNIFLVAHSIAGIIGTWVAQKLDGRVKAYFNIEGNLTAQDAYFSGQALNYELAQQFKDDFVEIVYEMAHGNVAFKRYFASVCFAHPEALMGWGKSSAQFGISSGEDFRTLQCPKLYYWGEKTTPVETQRFIEIASIPNMRFRDSSHWPMIDQPEKCSEDILNFFLENLNSYSL